MSIGLHVVRGDEVSFTANLAWPPSFRMRASVPSPQAASGLTAASPLQGSARATAARETGQADLTGLRARLPAQSEVLGFFGDYVTC